MARAAISEATQVRLLVLSRRRCCLCFGLDGDDTQKEGQIAHVDRDSSNPDLDNLAFLCLPHHDKYDTVPRQTKRILPDELRHYRSELYEHLSRLRADPPKLVLKNQELREWVKQRQRVTLGWSLLLVPLFLTLQTLWANNSPATANAVGAESTIQVIPEAHGMQNPAKEFIVRPEPESINDGQGAGKALISAPISSGTNEAHGKNANSNEDKPSDCTLNFDVDAKGRDPRSEDEQKDSVRLVFPCLQSSFEPGDVFYSGSITQSYALRSTSSGAFPATQSGLVSLRWDNVEVRYLGSGEFAAEEVWSLHSSKFLPGGGRVLSLRPGPARPWPEPYFDLFGEFPVLKLIFAMFILSIAIAWSSRFAWERHLVRRHHLTVKG